MTAVEYISLVDTLAAKIAAGTLKPGDRLPPQRTFAFENGIAASTAGRVYAELLRRGLAVGEVGRGTFVAGRAVTKAAAQYEPHERRIDLEFNFPTIPEQASLIARSLDGLHRPDVIGPAMAPVTQRRLDAARTALCTLLATPDWQPEPDALVLTGSGRQSIAAAISALVPVGGRLALEALSYPMIKGIAARLGAFIAPIAMDAEGMRPEHITRAHRAGALSAIYLQPVMHNPLGHSMSTARRIEIVLLAEKLGIPIIEDFVYRFLSDAPPLAALAPDTCIVIDSLSKRLAPGASIGMLCVPRGLRDRVAASVRAGAWSVAPLGLEIGTRLIADGTAAEITRLKRHDAEQRQAIVAKHFAGFVTHADPRSYHVWLELPEGWRSEPFVAAAARAGVAVSPSSAFAMQPGHAPNAIRLALGLPTHEELQSALARLVRLLEASPGDSDMTE